MRARSKQRAGIDAVDIYGLSEVMGPGVASECIESKDGPVIWEDHFYPEIIDPDTGEVLPDGEEGELVFTSLTKEALPIIRYRTRDLTRLLPPTSRSMRRMGKITGRSDDMLIIRGVNVFPSQIEELILQDAGAGAALPAGRRARRPSRQARSAGELREGRIRRRTRRSAGRELKHRIKTFVGVTTSVTLLAAKGIERTLTGKARRVVDQRPKNYQGGDSNERRIHLRRHPHPLRPLRRRARRRARRRPGRAADRRAHRPQSGRRLVEMVDDVYYGCANQAGEDNRNVGRMAALLAGLPVDVPGSTINRLCGSSLDAVGLAARAIRAGEAHLIIAGGVESMTRAPFVMGKADSAFSRAAKIEDTTIGWRFVNPLMKAKYGIDSMPETAENVARIRHQAAPTRTRSRCAASSAGPRARGRRVQTRSCRSRCRRKRASRACSTPTSIRVPTPRHRALAKLKGVVTPDGSVTAGNASGVNDGACACCWRRRAPNNTA
jgi:hypothetical protein